jgi:hypothetical protein
VAVVQISRIQLRRGRKNTASGLPQLASGELGWAIDSQELYIGNGSVAEGAPQVGNTKILTDRDDLFEIAKDYIYKEGTGSVQTGTDSSNPVVRTLQQRLDDNISIRSFGATGKNTQDATALLQRAVDQLYLNNGSESNVGDRVLLRINAGTYRITDTIYIPPHATIIGDGAGKTIIVQETAEKSVFTTVSDESTPGSYVLNGEYNTQARNIRLEGMTLQTTSVSSGLVLQSCRDSYFENLTIAGIWTSTDGVPVDSSDTFDIGLSLNSKNGGVETVRNEFSNCHVDGFAYGVVSNWDINDNTITTSNFSNLAYGVAFGKDMLIDGNEANGTATGPHNNIFAECVFENCNREALLITEGTYSVSRNNRFITCGNDGGSDAQPVYPVITFAKLGNESVSDFFTRTKVLSYTQGTIITGTATINAGEVRLVTADTSSIVPGQLVVVDTGTGELGASTVTVVSVDSSTQFSVNIPHLTSGTIGYSILSSIITQVPYIPEVTGPCNFEWGFEHAITIRDGQSQTIFRLPNLANQSFVIDYIAQGSSGYTAVRSGTLKISTDASGSNITVSDDYDYAGDEIYVDSVSFDAIIDDIDGDGDNETIVVKSNVSDLSSTSATRMKFRVKTKQIVI